jgi:hypothetical protein
VVKEAWVEILIKRIAVVKGSFGSPPASQQGEIHVMLKDSNRARTMAHNKSLAR